MATADSVRRTAGQPGRPQRAAPRRIRLSVDEVEDLRDEIARRFANQSAAESLLRRMSLPRDQRPVWTSGQSPGEWWDEVFELLDSGVIDDPWRRTLRGALRVYRYNSVFVELAEGHGLIEPAGPPADLDGADDDDSDDDGAENGGADADDDSADNGGTDNGGAENGGAENGGAENGGADYDGAAFSATDEQFAACHVIVRASSEQDRVHAAGVLAEHGLAPAEVWSTAHAVSYQVDSADVTAVRAILDRTDLSWTLVPPGVRDYLLSAVYVTGPDGRRFRLTDAPAQQTVGNVAGTVIEQQYGGASADRRRPTVIDRDEGNGQVRRLDPEQTLHDAGVQDGGHLRVAFEATAGAINPLDRRDALVRVRNEIVTFAAGHPGFEVRGLPPTLPTEYEIEFTQRSFAPPAVTGGEPGENDRQTVLIQLGAGFPETPPFVFWLSPIFHPNVFPNYDCPQLREKPYREGHVCLGVLAESYRSSMNFGELCQLLIDMAAYRNFSLFEETGRHDQDGSAEVHVNFYDRTAAAWVFDHADRVAQLRGRPLDDGPRPRSGYANVVEIMD
ncbi:effector-associated domain EAD1-containing protein [Frankia sp. QA3]|uniref:effector-associated domain EAD1-containing protein n=1 Tax=Frankia sp. QA3 TaxID=710111 RepID=UPI000269C519|nr:effector-associated domain EAD1-containing protein [Frankia sp. QA3]EIV94373.1 hypothetical protein FraQA3DRAFT_4125 [Frankia sp. QA3]